MRTMQTAVAACLSPFLCTEQTAELVTLLLPCRASIIAISVYHS